MSGGRQIFITGGNGYIGSVIVEYAIAQGYTVHALSRSEASDANLTELGAVPVRGDLTSLDVIREQSAAADVILLLATPYTLQHKSYDDVWPIDKACLDAAVDGVRGTNKPILTTSGSAFVAADPSGAETDEDSPINPDPLNGRGKAEEYALELAKEGIRTMSIRLAPYVYGRGGSGVKLFMGMAAQSRSMVLIDGGKNHVTTVHVDDAAQLYLLAMKKGEAGQVYNATTETDVTARQLMEAMASAVDVPIKALSFDDASAMFGNFLALFLTLDNRASGGKARKKLGWQPTQTGILDEINNGSYQTLAKSLKSAAA